MPERVYRADLHIHSVLSPCAERDMLPHCIISVSYTHLDVYKRQHQPHIEIKKEITGGDFSNAGGISSELKNILQQAGLPPQFIRRVVIATYEAEMNVVIHAYRGTFSTSIYPDHVQVVLEDEGPGIPDVDLAFQEGFSTAPAHIREMEMCIRDSFSH